MPYRVEQAAQGRAVCKNKECKDAGVKIAKGEFRMGTLVTIHEHQSWTWKHWGCVTPLQISHLQEESGGDTDMVDGYDELPPEFQEKVEYALEHGHVADEDWKGDVACNRPGAKGFRAKAPKAKKGKKAKNEEEEEASDHEAEEPKPKKKRGRLAKEVDEEPEAPAPKKARGRPRKAVVKEEDPESEAEKPKAKKPAKGKKAAAKKEEEVSDGGEDDESEAEDPKPQRGRKKASAAATDSKKPPTPKKYV
ncbi:zf-PARP-domain-containing protein [Periconia macrospinosa]|uniref:Zf-PARP-domain-containing protein n=1 Tax=Periconia macrospinosa TaxID=97972 RepID=A0A2V1E6C9_9PLEO|nr:zf-PARP-domain-containing protein [Periconia macrospinosa]